MKRLYWTLGILAALLAASLVNALCLHRVVDHISVLLEETQALAEQADYTGALSSLSLAEQFWEDHMLYLDIILSHEETDPVEVDFREAHARLELEDGEEYAAIGARLQKEVSLLWETERPVFANIL